jgi:hypothetical protein
MNITEIPFNHFLGIKRSSANGPYLLELDDLPVFGNHLHTVHAGVLLALAEACSAEYLLRTFEGVDADVLVVVRRVHAKFKKLVKGRIFSKAHTPPDEIRKFSEILALKGMAIIAVAVEVVDDAGVLAMTAVVDWFIQKPKRP